MKDPESKTAFYSAVARKILEFEEELERENYIESVAQKYQVGFENLRKLVLHQGSRIGAASKSRPLKSGVQEKKKKEKENGMKQSQKLMLTWLVEDPTLFDKIKPYLGPEDFTEQLYRQAAEILFAQCQEGSLNPAGIISMFTDEEQQREIASLFNASLKEITTPQKQQKALQETIIRLKENSISYRSKHLDPADMEGLQRLVADKRNMQKLFHIKF